MTFHQDPKNNNCPTKNKFEIANYKVFIYKKTKKWEIIFNLGKDTGDIKFTG